MDMGLNYVTVTFVYLKLNGHAGRLVACSVYADRHAMSAHAKIESQSIKEIDRLLK